MKKIIPYLLMMFFLSFLLEGTGYAMDVMVETQVAYPNTNGTTNNGVSSIVTKQFDIQVEYGLSGIVKAGTSLPISVTVKNLGDDFEGVLRVVIYGSYYSSYGGVAYDNDMALASGVSKTWNISAINNYNGSMRIGIQVLDEKEKIILNEMVYADSYYYDSIFTGVLSDDFMALNYFDGAEVETKMSHNTGAIYQNTIVELQAEDIPDSATGLSVLNYLILNDFDTSKLSDTQYEAIQEWVSMGGILIVGTGPDSNRTMAMFDDTFLEGSLNEATSGALHVTNQSAGVTETISFSTEDGFYSVSVTGGNELNGENMEYETGLSLIQKKTVGKGAIVVTGFNLGSSVIENLKGKYTFANALLADAQTSFTGELIESGMKGSNTNYWRIYNLLDMLFDVKVPNILLYAIFFIAYVLIAGPIGYLILKAIDKREAIWALIPGCAIVFTVLIAILSIPSRITKPVSSNFTLMTIQDGTVKEDIFMALQTPDIRSYEIQLNPEYTNFSPLRVEENNIFGNNNYNQWNYCIKNTPEGYLITTNNSTTFTTDYMMFEKVNNTNGKEFDIQIEGNTAYFYGSVTNNTGYDLKEAVICYGNFFVFLGDFKNGETKTFTANDNNWISYLSGWTFYDYFESGTKQWNKLEYAYDFLCEKYGDVLNYDEGFVAGYIFDYDKDVITDIMVEENGAAMVYQPFTKKPEDITGTYIQNLFDYQSLDDPNYKNYEVMDFEGHHLYKPQVDLQFNVYPVTSISKMIKTPPQENYWGWYEDVLVYGYNYTTGEYDLLFADGSKEMTFEEACPYINEKGMLEIRFECTEVYSECAPGISIIGEERK